ncbi:hypothetical protein Tco_1043748 [Tanacetum coccineum]|uniref:DUF4283 domain-containing protein n=1 Tax=Tanacetum coccineum TaxID=301880 RepID=A0ABQ5GMY7_9ASTR
MERKIDGWEKSQNVPSEPTDGIKPPPPPETQTEHVNVVFTGSGKLREHMIMKPDHRDPNAQDNTRRLGSLLPKLIYSPCIVDWGVLNQMRCGEEIEEMLMIRLIVEGTNDEIFTSEAWLRVFNIKERIYTELCHEFYSTYEFDEVCTNEELNTKKIIKFRLCGRAFSWTLLDFARRLGLYHNEEIEEDGFDFYFQGGLRSDENFNAREYWASISR